MAVHHKSSKYIERIDDFMLKIIVKIEIFRNSYKRGHYDRMLIRTGMFKPELVKHNRLLNMPKFQSKIYTLVR